MEGWPLFSQRGDLFSQPAHAHVHVSHQEHADTHTAYIWVVGREIATNQREMVSVA